jgi:PKD repeat protein
VVDADGAPVQDTTVFFTSSDGELVQPGVTPRVGLDSAKTNSQGVARATLVVNEDDADEIDVTVTAGALTATATLTKNVVGEQRPPTAQMTIEPATGEIGRVVTFQSTSTDPNPADTLVVRWTIDSTDPTGDEGTLAPTTSTRFSRTYSVAQDLTVTLEVSDDPAALTAPQTPGIWDDQVARNYKICANRAPIADGPDDVTRTGVTFPVTISLDGRASSDPDNDPLTYSWSCGNGTTAGNTSIANCTYTAAGTFTVTLTVTDNPTGCTARSDTDQILVSINVTP